MSSAVSDLELSSLSRGKKFFDSLDSDGSKGEGFTRATENPEPIDEGYLQLMPFCPYTISSSTGIPICQVVLMQICNAQILQKQQLIASCPVKVNLSHYFSEQITQQQPRQLLHLSYKGY